MFITGMAAAGSPPTPQIVVSGGGFTVTGSGKLDLSSVRIVSCFQMVALKSCISSPKERQLSDCSTITDAHTLSVRFSAQRKYSRTTPAGTAPPPGRCVSAISMKSRPPA
jgi:hypothetical protein